MRVALMCTLKIYIFFLRNVFAHCSKSEDEGRWGSGSGVGAGVTSYIWYSTDVRAE